MSEKEIEHRLFWVVVIVSAMPSVVAYLLEWVLLSKVLFFSWVCVWVILCLWACLSNDKGGKN